MSPADDSDPARHSDRAVIRQSSLTGVAAGASVIAGLILDVSIAARFGAGKTTDAFFVSARIPLGVIAVVMVAANQALVPTFRTSLSKFGAAATHRLVSMIVTVVLAVGVCLLGAVWLAAEPLMRLTAPGISGAEAATAASMVPVVFAIVPMIAVSEVMRAYLNARYAFVAPALMNVVLNGLAATVVLAGPILTSHRDIRVVAFAYLIGASAQVTFMVAMALRRGLRFRPGVSFADPALRSVGGLSVRPLAAAGLNPVARLGEQLLVSFLPPGSITILSYGNRLISAIGGTVFFRSVVVALLPRLTEAHNRGDEKDELRITGLGLRMMLAISLPLTVFMAVLARPTAQAVFHRGNFTRSSAALLGAVLAVYSISLVGSAVQRVLLAPFFARLDTRVPLRNTIYGVAANLLLLPLLALPFGRANDNAILGVALAYSLAQFVNVGHAYYSLRRTVGTPQAGLRVLTTKLLAASLLSGASMIEIASLLHLGDPLGRIALLLRTAAAGAIGAAVLGIAMTLLVGGNPTSVVTFVRGRPRAGTQLATGATAPYTHNPPVRRRGADLGGQSRAMEGAAHERKSDHAPGQPGDSRMTSIGVVAQAPPSRGLRTGRTLLVAICALAMVALSVESAVEGAIGTNKLLVILPVTVFAGLGMVALGLVNFENFVLATIVLRSSMDVLKPSGGNSGSAGVATASASGLDPAGGLAILFILMSFFWYLSRKRANVRTPRASIHRVCLILFAGAGFLSIIDSSNIFVSVLEGIRVSAVVVMLAVLEVMLVDRAAVQRLISAVYLSALVPVGFTIFNILTHHAQFTSGGFSRYQGTFSQPNPFAIYLTMLIVMGAAVYPHLALNKKVGMGILLSCSVVCLYYTYTRSAWIAAVLGVFAVAILGRRKVMLGFLVGMIMLSLVAVPTIVQRFSDLGQSTSANGYATNSLQWRFSYWGDVLPLVNKDPITGIGLKMSSFETDQHKEPHNDFLRAYVETGVVGTVAYLVLLLSMVLVSKHALRFTRSRPRDYERSIAVGFSSCVIAFVLISIVSNVITEVIVLWYYVAFAAAAYAVTQYRENAILRGLPVPREDEAEAHGGQALVPLRPRGAPQPIA